MSKIYSNDVPKKYSELNEKEKEIVNKIIKYIFDSDTFAKESYPFLFRLFKSFDEEKKRFKLFSDNLDLINKTNSKGKSFKLGINSFADKLNEEVPTGLLQTDYELPYEKKYLPETGPENNSLIQDKENNNNTINKNNNSNSEIKMNEENKNKIETLNNDLSNNNTSSIISSINTMRIPIKRSNANLLSNYQIDSKILENFKNNNPTQNNNNLSETITIQNSLTSISP